MERLVVVIGYDGAELLDIACVTGALTRANRLGAAPAYRIKLATPAGRPVSCDGGGMVLDGGHAVERIRGPLDTLVVSGGFGHETAARTPALVGHVRRLAAASRRIASVCTGANILAAAGLLDGYRATTHWKYAPELAAQYPSVTVDAGPIFIREGNISTAAGVTSALDLTLAFIEEDHGAALARDVARELVTYLQRPGNQTQMSLHVAAPPPEHDLVSMVIDHITAHLDHDLTTPALAGLAGVSERHLTRLFTTHLGHTPGRHVRRMRTDAAAQLLATTTLPVDRIATRCGFHNPETLRRAFLDHYGIPPTQYRTQSSTAATNHSRR